MDFTATGTPTQAEAVSDWKAAKATILAGIDVEAEYAALGVRFTGPRGGNGKGVRECHAAGREDAVPSAFVNVGTGRYFDSGGGGESLSFWDFAQKHGRDFGSHADVVRHFAARAGVHLGRIAAGKGGKIREAIYTYRDEAGAVRYGVFRYVLPNGKKTFTQHPPDGRGGWRFGAGCMDGVGPLPYRLPELLAADPADPVWVVEGEKDADRLAELGLVATTNHQGAASSYLWETLARYLAGRECYVLPDNDRAGAVHAHRVAGCLSGIARTVKVVALPGLPPKGDVSDWLELGHDLDELGRLAKAAPEWSADATPPGDEAEGGGDPDRDATVADLRPTLAADAWVWPGWLARGALAVLASEPGTGKTRLCFDLHRRIVRGLPWPDGAPMLLPRDSKVLWVAADGQWQEMADIPAAFGVPDDLVVLNATASDPYDGTTLQTPEELAAFDARIGRVKPVIVFVDTITNSADFKSQDSADAKRQYKPLQEIAARHQTVIVCVTHLNAGGKVLGRRAVEKCRVAIQLECPDPEGQPDRRKLWVTKSKAVKPPALGVTMGDEGNEYDLNPPEAPAADRAGGGGKNHAPPPKLAECMNWLTARLALGRTRVNQVRREAEEAGYGAGTLYRSRDKLGVTEEEIDGYKFWELTNGHENGGGDVPF